MDQSKVPRLLASASPKMVRETSPKRKRTDDISGVVTSEPYPRVLPCHMDEPTSGKPPSSTDSHERRAVNKDVEDFLRHCNDRVGRGRTLLEAASSRRLLHTMTATQSTQAHASRDLLGLITKLHDWARHLNTQEQYLHRLQVELIDQQRELSKQLLDAATKQIETDFILAEKPTEPTEPAEHLQIQQLKSTIGVLETNIEILISELILEREARDMAEAKLKAKEDHGRDSVISPPAKPGGDEVDFDVSLTDSKTSSPVPWSAGSSCLGDAKVNRFVGQIHSLLDAERQVEQNEDAIVRRRV